MEAMIEGLITRQVWKPGAPMLAHIVVDGLLLKAPLQHAKEIDAQRVPDL